MASANQHSKKTIGHGLRPTRMFFRTFGFIGHGLRPTRVLFRTFGFVWHGLRPTLVFFRTFDSKNTHATSPVRSIDSSLDSGRC